MRVGSLFSGIGGLELGLERAGMHITWQVEVNPWRREHLKKNWPNAAVHEDVREASKENLTAVDLLCGGFPCQDISLANTKGEGLEGKRSGLWSEFARLIGELQPRWVLIENVAALRSKRGGLPLVLQNLAALGYDAEWHVLPAGAFGAPHKRERLFILAYPAGERSQAILKADTGDVEALDAQEGKPARVGGSSDLAFWRTGRQGSFWESEPDLAWLVDGVPDIVERISAYGDAVVPQIPEWIGRQVMQCQSALAGNS
jgi:DNA (cytosine-5)-methyltransferase 1